MDDDETESGADRRPTERKRKVPRKATRKSLENGAVYYLKRFSSSSANLKRVLLRRVERAARHHDTDREECRVWIDEIVTKLTNAGFLDDLRYAEVRAQSLHRRGTSRRTIRLKLMEKGVPGEVIDDAVAKLFDETEEPDFAAAVALARRRRLGPYRVRGVRSEMREKDLASIARAGFDYGTAKRVIDAETITDLEDKVAEGER